MDKNQKAELYDKLDDLFHKLREAQSTVELLVYLLSSEDGNPGDKYVKDNFSSALHIANDALYNVWEKMTDLGLPLKQALTEE